MGKGLDYHTLDLTITIIACQCVMFTQMNLNTKLDQCRHCLIKSKYGI